MTADRMQKARDMLAAHLTPGSVTRASVLKGSPYPFSNVTIGQALKAICDALALVDVEREACAREAEAWSDPDNVRLVADDIVTHELRSVRAAALAIAAAIRDRSDGN